MRRQIIDCRSYATARRRCPWASVIAKVIGGYIAFESVEDYYTWRGQR